MRVDKSDLLAAADVVSLHLVLSERTRGILGAGDLARMKPGAILVNTARAQLVDERALIAAVQSGRIRAALDVFHREPLPADYPLARAANVVLTPHLGYGVVEVYHEYYEQCVENALAYLDGKPIRVLRSAAG
jgi:phosphoglycerate dehydrogenase-like enzyme